ncbi:MAG: type II secretion system protein GspL [Woeseia sp.]
MAEYLVIRLPADADQAAAWITVDSAGTRTGGVSQGALADAASDAAGHAVLVLVPGGEVLTTTVDIPVRNTNKLLSALPYALEEMLAEDVDDLHFAAGLRQANGRVPVAAVSHERMRSWLELLESAGITATRIIPETLGLAAIPGTISLLVDGDEIFINDGGDTQLYLQDVTPTDALTAIGAFNEDAEETDAAADAAPAARGHVLVYCSAADDERFRHEWAALRNELDSVDVKLLPDGVLPRLAVTAATGAGINLLQGRYGPKTGYGSVFAPWKYAAMLLLGFIVVGTATKAVNYVKLTREEAALQQSFQAEYQQVVPGAAEVDDPVRLVSSLRTRAGSSNNEPQVLLQALEQLAAASTSAENASIEAISFRSGVADIRVNAANVSVLDAMRQRIDQSGNFRAKIQSTDQVGDRVNSRIQIQAIE